MEKEKYTAEQFKSYLDELISDNGWTKKDITEYVVKQYLDGNFRSLAMLREVLLEYEIELQDETIYNLAKTNETISYPDLSNQLAELDEKTGNAIDIFMYLYDLGAKDKISKDQLEFVFYLATLRDPNQEVLFLELLKDVDSGSFKKYCKNQYKLFKTLSGNK